MNRLKITLILQDKNYRNNYVRGMNTNPPFYAHTFYVYKCLLYIHVYVYTCINNREDTKAKKIRTSKDGDVSWNVDWPPSVENGASQAALQSLFVIELIFRTREECWCHWCHQTERLQDEAQGICGLLLQYKQEKGPQRDQPGVLRHEVRVQPAALRGVRDTWRGQFGQPLPSLLLPSLGGTALTVA